MKDSEKKTVLLYYSLDVYCFNGETYLLDTFAKYIKVLEENSIKLYLLCTPLYIKPPQGFNNYRFDKATEIVALPWFSTMVSGYLKYFQFKHVINKLPNSINHIIVRYPEPLWHLLYRFSKKINATLVLHFVGNPIAVNDSLRKKNDGMKSFIFFTKYLMFVFERYFMHKIIDDSVILLSNGSEIPRYYFSEIPDRFTTVLSSTLSESDFYIGEKSYFANSLINITFIGYLKPVKGVTYLLDAAKDMDSSIYRFNILGGGELEDSLRKQYKHVPNIVFFGHVDRSKITSVLDESDSLIVPSLSEGTPRVIFEAMARKVLIAGTKVGGIPDLLGNGQYGVLLRPHSTSDIQFYLESLHVQKVEYLKMANDAYEFAKINTTKCFIRQML